MNSLKRLFTAPTFEDEVKTQQAYMLHVILWMLVCVPIPFVIYSLSRTPENITRTFIQVGIGETVNVILLIMLQRGFVRAATIIQVSAFWLFFTATAMTGSGVRGEAYLLGYGLVIAIAGILMGGVGALTFTCLSLAAGGLMVFRELQGNLASAFESSPLTTWIVSIILFPVGAVIQNLSSRKVQNILMRARASEERYRLISKVSSDYTFSTEVDSTGTMRLSWVAGAFEEISGYTYEEYVASGGWLAHLHPDDIEKDTQDMSTLRKGQPVISEVRTYRKDTALRWVQVSAYPVWDDKKNRMSGIVGAVKDITERKQSEEALRYERDLLQVFMDNIPDSVYFKDAESSFLRVNKAQAKFLKLDNPENAIGKTDLDFQPREIAQQFMEEEKQIIESKQPISNRIEFNPTADGKPRWLSDTKVPVKDPDGRVIGTIGISRDITEQKQAEEREARRRAMLEKVVNLGKRVTEATDLQMTLERIWHGVHDNLGFDRIAIFLYNPERNSFDGTLGTNIQGQLVEEWDQWYPLSDIAIFSRLLEQPDGLYFTHNYDVENEFSEDHEMYGVKEYAAVAAWAGDKPIAVICVDNLMTQHLIDNDHLEALRLFSGYAGLAIENTRLNAALEDDLNHRKTLIEELETKNAELERFTYTVSHDLKSPLVTITGFLGYLEKDALAGDAEKVKGNINRISNAARKMHALLNDLLELSRIGRLMNPPEDVRFSEIVNEAVDRVRGKLDEINALVEIQRDLPIIHCDRIRLVEVVQNLVENAAKYSNPMSQPRIEIGAQEDGQSRFTFFVRDNGIGIAPKYHDNIFGLFNKLNATSAGTGIGLTLVKRIIEVHGGHIWIESETGKGATFFFTLPTKHKE